MKTTLWQRLDLLARSLWPFTLTLLLLIVAVVPLRVPYLPPISPDFLLISVYYWALHRPTILPSPAVFLLGVLHDFLGGAPLGVGVLVLLIVFGVSVSQRRVFLGAPFAVVWLGFAVAAAGATLGTWVITSLVLGVLLEPWAAIFGCLLTVGLYPAVGFLFARAQRALPRQA